MINLDYPALLNARQLQPLYRPGTRCPGCGHGAWHIGHRSAECGRCSTVLPLAPAEQESAEA